MRPLTPFAAGPPAAPRRPRFGFPLLGKLMLINVFVIGVGMLVVWLSMDILAKDYTSQITREFGVLPVRMHWVFLGAVHRYLMWTTLLALGLAAGFSYALTRQVLRPLREMRAVAERIAAGDYSRRVTVATGDEIGRLADDLNRMAASLQRIERFRRDMVSDVAHELRTPLTNMRGYLEGLMDGVVPAEKASYAILQDETLRLAALVENLLRLSEADGAALAVAPRALDARAAVEVSLRLVRARMDERGLTVTLVPAQGAWNIVADPDKFAQIVHNLLENAVRYTPAGGGICIRAEGGRQEFRITFENDCAAPPPGDFALYFERFYRAEKSRSREYGGAGLGLAIVRTLVEAHGGSVGGEVVAGRVRVWFTLPSVQTILTCSGPHRA